MLEISRFLGNFQIPRYHHSHLLQGSCPTHFHAEYGDYEITVAINSGVVSGTFPKRALKAVLEWYDLHKEQLLEDWKLVEEGKQPNRIEPLE